jgi:hypothetical protein
MFLPLLFRQKLCDELIIGVSQLLIHTVHNSDVLVLYEVDLFEIYFLRQRTCVISKEEISHGLSLER